MVKKNIGIVICFFVCFLGFTPLVLADDLSSYTIDYKLCIDSQRPRCDALRLGDRYLSTNRAAKGYLYACRSGNPSAPGSTASRITWIDWGLSLNNILNEYWTTIHLPFIALYITTNIPFCISP